MLSHLMKPFFPFVGTFSFSRVTREGYGKLSASIDDFTERQELTPPVKQQQQQQQQLQPVTQQQQKQQPEKQRLSTQHNHEQLATKLKKNQEKFKQHPEQHQQQNHRHSMFHPTDEEESSDLSSCGKLIISCSSHTRKYQI